MGPTHLTAITRTCWDIGREDASMVMRMKTQPTRPFSTTLHPPNILRHLLVSSHVHGLNINQLSEGSRDSSRRSVTDYLSSPLGTPPFHSLLCAQRHAGALDRQSAGQESARFCSPFPVRESEDGLQGWIRWECLTNAMNARKF